MTIPDRTSDEVAKRKLVEFLPSAPIRKTVCRELATFWQYAKRNFPDKAFITLACGYIRMNVGMVEVFVIRSDGDILLVVDKTVVDKTMVKLGIVSYYKSCADAVPMRIPVVEFDKVVPKLRPAIFSIINKLARTRKNPAAPIGHSLALANLLTTEYPYDPAMDFPDEVGIEFREGDRRTIVVDAYERDPKARAECLRHYKTFLCQICGFDFAHVYGSIGDEFIHVHHLRPIAVIGKEGGAEINPETDMLPVCPNCHAMLHTRKPVPLTPDELKAKMRR